MKQIKYILISMFFFPNIVFAYLPAYEGYDLKECFHLKFEPQGYSGSPPPEKGINGRIQKGKGSTIYFKGTYIEKDGQWTFNGNSNFPLANSSFKHIDIGWKCVKGCSNHGIEYLFETSDEGENSLMWKFLKEYKLKVKKHCPTLRI